MRWRRDRTGDLPQRVEELEARLAELEGTLEAKPWTRNLLLPSPSVYARSADEPFMRYSTCSAADFFHPRFAELSALLKLPTAFHRKNWEWVRILHTALERGLARPGKTALGFGVGSSEPLAAVLAGHGVHVTATDAPAAIGAVWSESGEYARRVSDLAHEGIVDDATLLERVRFAECDMNDIGDDFRGFDFAWSSCALEHLGDLDRGLAFVEASLETLADGGVACHTTEFNLSSNDGTIEAGGTVLYRRGDLERLLARLRDRGHRVDELAISPDAHHLDAYVDTPPYTQYPHLRLELEGYASTSVALVVTRGGAGGS